MLDVGLSSKGVAEVPVANEDRGWLLPVAPIESGERAFDLCVRRWRASAEVRDYDFLLDLLTREMARLRGSEFAMSRPADEGSCRELLAEGLGDDPRRRDAVLGEAHGLGWFHQHWGARGRKESFRDHHHREEKHGGQTVTTQLYTPRWVADFLARRALLGLELVEPPTICDPAVGGGQMLLAGLDALCRAYPEREIYELVCGLYGTDLDPRAVEVTRRGLMLEVTRRLGRRCSRSEACIETQIRVDDGLFGEAGLYDIVLANPPYMGARSMPVPLKEALRGAYAPYHSDLYAAFIARCHRLARHRVGILAQQTIWYLSSFAKARADLLSLGRIESFMHLGAHAFTSLSGEKANVVAFVQGASGEPAAEQMSVGNLEGLTEFIDLRDLGSPEDKRAAYEAELVAGQDGGGRSRALDVAVFAVIPRQPLAHWLPPALRHWFKEDRCLGDIADVPGGQNKTGDNRRFVRPFEQVETDQIRYSKALWPDGDLKGRWVFYSKGGRYAPWWGGWQWVVDWSEPARDFYGTHATANLLDEAYWFREGISYTDFGGAHFNARWMPSGCLFDMAGPAIFPLPTSVAPKVRLFALLAILNSTVASALLNALNPTLHYQVRDVRLLPLPWWDEAQEAALADSARELVEHARLLATAVPGDPLHRRKGLLAGCEPVQEIAAAFTARELALDRMVCELYGVPEMVGPRRPRHPLVVALEKMGACPG